MTRETPCNILVTGGAGFIGSSLIPFLVSNGYNVTAVDHMSSAKKRNVSRVLHLDNFEFIQLDLLDSNKLNKLVKRSNVIFHLASNVEVRKAQFDTNADYLNNLVTTRNLLESMRKSECCKKIIYTSSSVVYGEPSSIPTPETYGPLKPISLYGASKLASEALISGYVGSFGLQAVIFRMANVVGPMSTHGVIFDFFRKLNESHGKYLEILGDGKQKKSYMYIDDCINALLLGLDKFDINLEIFNVGSEDQIDIDTIAQMITTELRFDPVVKYFSDQMDGRGWTGDVKDMLMSTERIKERGWKSSHSSKESVYLTIKRIIDQGLQ